MRAFLESASLRPRRNLTGELLFERIQRFHPRWQLRLFDEHDWDPVAHRVAQAADFGDEEISLLAQRAARQRTAEDREQLGIDGVGVLGGHAVNCCEPEAV